MFKKNAVFLLILTLSIVFYCAKEKEVPPPKEKILVRIGDKNISMNEFIRRAEYTIRPNYCKGNHNIQKKIVLNSLIAEKLMAREAEKDTTITENEHFQRFIDGRKEQAMRQWLFNNEGTAKVKLTPGEINKVYSVAGRKYKLKFFNVNSASEAANIKNKIEKEKIPFEVVFKSLTGSDSVPHKEVEYSAQEHDLIHDALYREKLKKNQVIGPIRIEDDFHIFMKVDGWTDRVAFSGKDQSQRWNDVKDRLTEQSALKIYEDYVAGIMKGKRIEFVKNSFYKLVELSGPLYFTPDKEKRELFLNAVFSKEPDDPQIVDMKKGFQDIVDEPLFRIDGKDWTVREFEQELGRHPLVFRKRKMKKTEFAEQLKLAIVDMIRDSYLTEEAYKRGYDTVNVVKRTAEMWKDADMALYSKRQYLKKVMTEEDKEKNIGQIQAINKYLNPYIEELQKKYSDSIEVNVEDFNDVKLTRIDMFVVQKNVPFPVIVPSFPQITTDHKLDYGNKMVVDTTRKDKE